MEKQPFIAIVLSLLFHFKGNSQSRIEGWGDGQYSQNVVNNPDQRIIDVAAGTESGYALFNNGVITGWAYDLAAPGSAMPSRAISARGYNVLSLRIDSTVIAWGSGSSPVPAGLNKVVAIAAGNGHAMALRSDGTVLAWGSNSYGQSTVPAGLSQVKSIACGNDFSVALKEDGSVVSWGRISAVSPLATNVVAIAAGALHTLALRADRKVVAWGTGFGNEITIPEDLSTCYAIGAGVYHSFVIQTNGKLKGWGYPTAVEVLKSRWLKKRVKKLASGENFNIILYDDGTAEAYGSNTVGQLYPPKKVPELAEIETGDAHTLGITLARTVVGWGDNGQSRATPPANLGEVLAVSAGGTHSMALRTDSTVVCWGNNASGQTNTPIGLNGVVAISAGNKHSVALKKDGSVVIWGTGNAVPATLGPVRAIVGSSDYTMAIKADSTIAIWGFAYSGQSQIPAGLSGVVAIAASGFHAVALLRNGKVVAWGDNSNGRCTVPPNLPGIREIYANNNNTLAVDSSGQKYLFGTGSLPVFSGPTKRISLARLHGVAIVQSQEAPPTDTSIIISGKIYVDNNTNCVPDSGESTSRPFVVALEPAGKFALSEHSGAFRFTLPGGITHPTQTIRGNRYQFYDASFQPVCPTVPDSIHLNGNSDTLVTRNLGYNKIPCHFLEVRIASNRRRRCFRNQTLVDFYNQGSGAAPAAYIDVEFPSWVHPISASLPHSAIAPGTWRFHLGDVLPKSGGQITIVDSVVCGNESILGQMQCTKASVFPLPDCPTSPDWNGAELELSGTCDAIQSNVVIKNTGTASMADSTDYWIFTDSILVRKARVRLYSGDSLVLEVMSNGRPVHAVVNQVSGHPRQKKLSFTMVDCLPGQVNTAIQNQFSLYQQPNSQAQCLPVQGAYDPNDKLVFPKGFTSENIVPVDTRLEYLIRFQNTGTDTAFNIVIADTLDDNLNPASIEMGLSSHLCRWQMKTTDEGKTVLVWSFLGINLPDSGVNESRSHGFIQFRISPEAGLAQGTMVQNQASIYFDFNQAIVTLPAISTLKDQFFTEVITAEGGLVYPVQGKNWQDIGVRFYPNPVTRKMVHFESPFSTDISVFDTQGRLLFRKSGLKGKQNMEMPMQPGFYFLSFVNALGKSRQKLLVE